MPTSFSLFYLGHNEPVTYSISYCYLRSPERAGCLHYRRYEEQGAQKASPFFPSKETHCIWGVISGNLCQNYGLPPENSISKQKFIHFGVNK